MPHPSLWQDLELPRFAHDTLPEHVDVVIIGGGITGLTAALRLKQAGKRVAVLEKERIGHGETSRTSAHVTYVTDLRLSELVDHFGRDAAQLAWRGGATAIDLIETHVVEYGIACGFQRVPNFLYAALHGDEDESSSLRDEASLASDLGFAAQFVASGPISGKPAVSYADQAIVQPLAYIAGLAAAIDGDGSFVCEDAEVSEVKDVPRCVVVRGQQMRFDELVVATHVPLTGLAGTLSATLFQTKLYPYSSYVVSAQVPDDTLFPGLFNDTSDPYYYLRVHDADGARHVVFGGEDHKTGQESDPDACFAKLEATLREVVPNATIDHRWSGQVIESSDGLPFIGMTAEHQFASTGYAGNGLTFGTLGGLMMSDAVLGVKNPWQTLFDPNRTNARGLLAVLTENIDYPYHLVLDRLRRDRTSGVESVAPGDGRVIEVDGQTVACHRTEAGEVIMVKAACTHLGCLVRWNRSEHTWDCPCHGSRFTPEGDVLGGPAETPLDRVS